MPRRWSGDVAPWDRRVIVINEAKMEDLHRYHRHRPAEISRIWVGSARRENKREDLDT
ncbi:hypothetical protein X777_08323 [Ooceraea biroi]|uniref:Uncharacterized protein n=1 Tax=Ooceraea biroi TaxID=2015173 RepID=A0A026WZH3_OOCBI|nr:hypothetical protein X777_08323 [Ooceraea biroi]